MTSCCGRRRSGRSSSISACRVSPSSRSERELRPAGHGERGIGRPPTIVVLAVIALLIWGVTQYLPGTVKVKEFEGNIRGIILSNPMMPDPEVVERLEKLASEVGVTMSKDTVRVERGSGMLMGGGIQSIQVDYDVDMRFLLFTWVNHHQAVVEP